MTEQELRDAIRRGPRGAYVFAGEELYTMAHEAENLRRAVLGEDAELAMFNRITLEGAISPAELEGALRTMPMAAMSVLVEWRDAPVDTWKGDDAAGFLKILSSPDDYPQAVLLVLAPADVFDTGTAKRPSSMMTKLAKACPVVNFQKQSADRLAKWVVRHLDAEGLAAETGAPAALVSIAGRDMYNLSTEIDKLTAYVKAAGRGAVTAADVAAAASSSPEEDDFALANAVVSGDRRAALAALYFHKLRREEPIVLLASVSRVVCDLLMVARLREAGLHESEIAAETKLHSYKVSLYCQAVASISADRLLSCAERCRKADRQMKTGSTGYAVLERLICTLPQRKR
ncbi:MAG: DNA polymerase III subunit delta [Clostridia bacterium]|nr:DNA polymerase III subunit delta [Clostridia bacterium]